MTQTLSSINDAMLKKLEKKLMKSETKKSPISKAGVTHLSNRIRKTSMEKIKSHWKKNILTGTKYIKWDRYQTLKSFTSNRGCHTYQCKKNCKKMILRWKCFRTPRLGDMVIEHRTEDHFFDRVFRKVLRQRYLKVEGAQS